MVAVLNDEQVMLKDMAAAWVRDRLPIGKYREVVEGAFPNGFDAAAFTEMAEMSWAGIVVPEEYGGIDFGFVSLGLVLEELGRSLAASPLVSSAVVVASALRALGSDAQKRQWLTGIASGTLIGALAHEEGGAHAPYKVALAARREGDGWRLDGIKRPVPDGMAADMFIVVARTEGARGDRDGLTMFAVPADAGGLGRNPLDQIDARVPALLSFDGVVVSEDGVLGPIGGAAEALDYVLDCGRAALCAEMLGAATQSFETTLDYLKTRVQFGQHIGSFQALQHRASSMFAELQLFRSAVESALAAVDAGSPRTAELVSLAKAIAGETLNRLSNEMIQMHGGIGMTHEHDAGLYLKRARVADQTYGNAAFHRERWGRINGF